MGYLVTTADLLTAIKRDAFLPTAQISFSDQEILAIGDDELYSECFPLLKSFNEGFLLEQVDSSFVAGQSVYTLPKYAMWNAVYLVQRTTNGVANWPDYARIEIDQLKDYQIATQGTPYAYFLLDNTITFVPTPGVSTTDAFRLWIYRRPGRMVPISLAAQVLSTNIGAGTVTYTAVPPISFSASSFHDFYSVTPPFRRLRTNVQATNLVVATQTFALGVVDTLQPGDWVSILDETVIPAVPFELQTYLKELIIKSMCRTQMDQEMYQVQKAEIVEKMKFAMIVPGNRTVGKAKSISLNRHPMVRRFGRLI